MYVLLTLLLMGQTPSDPDEMLIGPPPAGFRLGDDPQPQAKPRAQPEVKPESAGVGWWLIADPTHGIPTQWVWGEKIKAGDGWVVKYSIAQPAATWPAQPCSPGACPR